MNQITKADQVRGKKEKAKKKKPRDNVWGILNKAWKIQSKGIRSHGRCVACGSTKSIIAGHIVHGGRGKAWNMVDFNAMLPFDNVFPQCSFDNTYNPDGNGLLKRYFDSIHGILSQHDYDLLKSIKQTVWKCDELTAREVLAETIKRYGKSE